jgi:2',3'-cyclic-nucleotide 2'-phosphodiesterase (5'-nucleotidase family)
MEEAYSELIKSVKEQYDKVIVLSHHWYSYSKDLKEFSQSSTTSEINLIIGGHEHSPIPQDYERKIFYPLSFARSLYKMTLDEDFNDIEEIPLKNLEMVPEFEKPILQYEQETKIKEPVAKRLLDLTKKYSDPCPLGTFISDNMKRLGQTDIAFHSTGFTMAHIPLGESKVISEYDIDRVICKDSSFICKMELTASDLKQVFDNATSLRMYRNRGNTKFVQCSKNITLTGKENPTDKTYKIIQINIDGVDLLDKNGEVIDKKKKYTCTTDAYIAAGEQGFEVLKNIPSIPILDKGEKISLNRVLYKSLLYSEKTFDGNPQYPSFKIIDLT